MSDEILKRAKKRFEMCADAEAEARKIALDDLEFLSGEQWPQDVKNQRILESRPCLVINRMPQFVRQVVNDQKQNRPTINIHPVDDKADIETAKILKGLIRHIEYDSNAEAAYDTAFEGAVQKGFGFFRIITEYASPMSFNQKISIKPIANHFNVFLDPFTKEPDGSDAEFGFVFEDISREDFEKKYPDSDLASTREWDGLGTRYFPISDDAVRICEYFEKQYETKTICLLNDGTVIEKDKVLDPMLVVSERETQTCKVVWYKLNGEEILEKTEWAGSYIPIIPVYGSVLNIDGKVVRESLITHAKDPQRIYNFNVSNEVEAIALAPKAPFIVEEGQIPEEYEHMWKTANKKTYPYLPYKVVGNAPPPQRNSFEPAVTAISNARVMASEDIKATTGIYDASLGSRSNETSGKAIGARAAQAQTSNFHFVDNLTKAIRYCGRQLVDLIPKIYDSAQAIRIIGEDQQQEVIKINQFFEKNGEQIQYNFSYGTYDVTVDTGPSFQTKRQEALASMVQLTQAYPQVAQVAGDLMVKNMDWPGASEIAERLKKILPPQVLGEEGQQIPPDAQKQIQDMSQMIEQLSGALEKLNFERKMKLTELESKERIEFAKIEADLQKEMLKKDQPEAIPLIINEIVAINQRLQKLGIDEDFNPVVEPDVQENFNAGANVLAEEQL